jgi:hypothetical protein
VKESLPSPNRATLEAVAIARAHEQRVIREYQLIAQSKLRGETAEDRVAQLINPDFAEVDDGKVQHTDETESLLAAAAPATIHRLTRLDRRRLNDIPETPQISSAEIGKLEADWSIFCQAAVVPVREFEDEGYEE